MSRNSISKKTCACLAGIVACILGTTLFLLKAQLLDFILESVLVLKPNSPIINYWLKMPVQIPTDFYFFNWTNPGDFHNISIKPKFEQVGPYKFMQNMEKVNVVWNDNDTVTYNQVRTWDINQDGTSESLTEKITSINAATMGMAHYSDNWTYFVKKAVSLFLATTIPELYITRTVAQFLIDGYDDIIIDMGRYFPFVAPQIPRFTKLGWLFIRNGSSDFDGVFNKGTGVDGNFDIRSWNYYNETPYFENSCAQVQGSEAEIFSYQQSKDYIDIFISDICRYIRLDFEKEVIVKGILGYKYSIGTSTLDNGTLIAGNECFCAGDCLPSGMINVSSCRYGLPIFVSLPNFYNADSIYLDAVEGLHPDKSNNEAYIILEPRTAVPLKVVGRIQLNVFVHPVEDIQTHESLRELFFPLFWGEQTYIIEGHIEVLLKLYLYFPYIINTISIIFAILGFYLVTFVAYKQTLVCLFKKTCKQKYECKSSQREQMPLYT